MFDDMIHLTEAQQDTLARMRNFRVVAQFTSGAVVAVYDQIHQIANVIDTNGDLCSINCYLATLKPCPAVLSVAARYVNA